MSAFEDRTGVEELAALQHERQILVERHKEAFALYGNFGQWDARRKRILATCELAVRNEAADGERKITDKAADALAHTHPDYTRFLDDSLAARAQYEVIKVQVDAITERIRAREAELRFLSAEMHLSR